MTPTEIVQSTMPLCATLGITASEFTPERVVLHLDWQAGLCTSAGLLHGGALMALADSAGGASAFLNLPEGAGGTATIESKNDLLGGIHEGASIAATATPSHARATDDRDRDRLRRADGTLVAKPPRPKPSCRRA